MKINLKYFYCWPNKQLVDSTKFLQYQNTVKIILLD